MSAQYTAVAPRLAPAGSSGSYSCTFFPPALDPRIEITGAGAGPIVVVGTTGDPATPLTSTQAMAEALEDGRLVVVEADQHTGYNVNSCINDVVNDYLVDLVPPDERHRMSVRRRTRDRSDSTGGRSGIRTHGDPKDLNGFRGRPIRPLWHPSVERG